MKRIRPILGLALAASIISACSGGPGNVSSALPGTHTSSYSRAQAFGKRLYYSIGYRHNHPVHVMRTGAGTNNLVWGGGPVEHTPAIYLIFWGWQSSTDTTADPDGMAAYLASFFNSIGASSWINIDSQYTDGSGSVGNPSAQLAGTWYDSSKPPTNYTDANIQSEALAGVAHFGYDVDANYFVVTPHNYTTSGFGTQWCAYHSATTSSGGGLVSYTDFPYVPDAGTGCGMNFVNANGTLDGASVVGGHEEAETQTDPNAGSGWLDSSGQEIGDKCAWSSMSADVTFPNGKSYPVQPLWSNAVSGCAMSYGTVTTPPPTPTPAPTATPTATPQPTATPVPTPTPVPTATPCKRRHGRCV